VKKGLCLPTSSQTFQADLAVSHSAARLTLCGTWVLSHWKGMNWHHLNPGLHNLPEWCHSESPHGWPCALWGHFRPVVTGNQLVQGKKFLNSLQMKCWSFSFFLSCNELKSYQENLIKQKFINYKHFKCNLKIQTLYKRELLNTVYLNNILLCVSVNWVMTHYTHWVK